MNPRSHSEDSVHASTHDVQRAESRSIPFAIVLGVALVLLTGTFMVRRAQSKTNQVALASRPKPVSVVEPKRAAYRPFRTYIGTIQPLIEAHVGPQLVSAYVEDVLVRPGAVVKKGDVLATLDCRSSSAVSQAASMHARALEVRQKALANEVARMRGLVGSGFVSANEAEQREALSASQRAQLLAQKATLARTSIEVDDCVLRAPFAGEIATRSIDPGAFVRPGASIVSLVDRGTLRVTAEAPEIDYREVAPGKNVQIHVLASPRNLTAMITRRAPSAGSNTRTVHFEIDVPDPQRTIPVGTTAEVRIDVGEPTPALVVPLAAAAVRDSSARLITLEGNIARVRVVAVKGEIDGQLFLDPSLPAGTRIVTEGRELLSDGDRVEVGSLEGPPTALLGRHARRGALP